MLKELQQQEREWKKNTETTNLAKGNKMDKIFTAKTVEEAVNAAKAELNIEELKK